MTIGVMSITPFTAAGEVDHEALAAHLERMAHHDLSVYLCSQGSGEGLSLSTGEKEAVYRTAVTAIAGRREVIGAGIGLTGDTASAVEQVRVLGATGVDALQVFGPRPGALRPRDDEIERYFDEILDAAPCPVIVGDNVTLAGYEIGPELARRLLRRPGVVGLSYTSLGASLAVLTGVLRSLDGVVPVRVGLLHHLVNVAALGGAGVLCFDANVVPGLVVACWDAARAGGAELPERLRLLFELNAVLTRHGNPASIKSALAHLRLPAGHLRRPLLALDAAEDDELAARIDELVASSDLRAWL